MSNTFAIKKFGWNTIYSNNEKCNFLYRDFKNTNIKLCRYTREDNLADLMKGKLKIFRRENFSDKYEHGEYSNPLCIYLDPRITQEYNDRNRRFKEIIKSTKSIPAMCLTAWTGWDDYFFWVAFATNPKDICIIFSLKNLAMALKNNNFDFFISKMSYLDISNSQDYHHILFSKTPSYKHEKEYRIYLQNHNGTPIIGTDSIYVNIDFNLLNPQIVISPNADFATRKEELINKYPALKAQIIKSKIINHIK